MRRVFPLRPSETSLLVSYDNGAYEHEDAEAEEAEVSSSSPCNLKGSSLQGLHRRRSSTNFSVTFREDKSSPHQTSSRKFLSSVYPEFTEVVSPSPRSSLWTGSFHDDGDSTSFNFSDGTHRRATSSLSSSSSSSITYNPRGSASFNATQDVDAPFNTGSSLRKDVNSHIGTEFATCKNTNSHLVEPHTAIVSSIKPPLKPLQTSNSQASRQRDTPIHVVPRKVQENMHVHMDTSTNCRLLHRTASRPEVAARSIESSRSRSCLPRSRESLSSTRDPPISPKAYTCSTPFKYLTKCLLTSKTPQKERSNSLQANSPAEFSTLLNQLYAGESRSQGKASPRGRAARETEYIREEVPATNDLCSSTPRSLVRGRIELHDSDACSVAIEDWQSPLKCQSFSANMVSDYLRHVHEAGKSPSFRRAPKASSFHHESDTVSLMECKRRSSSMDFDLKAGKSSSNYSYKMVANGEHLDCNRTADLLAAEEKNTKNLTVLRREISKLCKDKSLLARELEAEIKSRQYEQKAAENASKHMEAVMEEKLITVEKDHAYAQACLEKEIDRRKKEWSAKLEKIGLEEKKLRERVTEMALERVELQKAIAFYKGREASLQTQAKDHELSAQGWMQRHCQSKEEALLLRQSFSTVCNRLGGKEHELDLVLQRSKVLERENAELLKEFSRLRRAFADQETTFEELWQILIDIVNGASDCKVDSLRRLHGELKVFSAREQALRYEIGVLQSQIFHTKQKNGLAAAEENFSVLEGNRMCSPMQHLSCSRKPSVQHKKDLTSETLDDLVKKLELTKQHMRQAEYQLEVKEEEVELLHSTLKERDHAMKDLQEELTSVKAQRDGLRKQVQQMGQEALELTLELSELRKVIEKLDDELMLKEGQISILRETCSDSEF